MKYYLKEKIENTSAENLRKLGILKPGIVFSVPKGAGCFRTRKDRYQIINIDENHVEAKNIEPESTKMINCSCGDRLQTFSEFLIYSTEKVTKRRKGKTLFKRVVLPAKTLETVEAALAQIDQHDLIFQTWDFASVFEKGTAVSLLFYGAPGTGKTMLAQAIAERLQLPLEIIQSAEIESSEPGQAERNIKARFMGGTKKVLLFDECDSLIADRDEVGMILGAQINALLSALELFNGVAIFTTNRLGRLDPAFERRVSAKIEFTMPDYDARIKIWNNLLPLKAPVPNRKKTIATLAKVEISGGHIKNVILNAARHAAWKKMQTIEIECFSVAMQKELQGKAQFEEALNGSKKLPRLGHGFTRSAGKVQKTVIREKIEAVKSRMTQKNSSSDI